MMPDETRPRADRMAVSGAVLLGVGEVATRSGVSVSALHFYEREGLITSTRTAGNQRRYARSTLRRIAFVRASQRVGISLAAIRAALDDLPHDRTPSPADWARLSAAWRDDLDARIRDLESLRDQLSSCIGCGCLSLQACSLTNPGDVLAGRGPGPRRLLGDRLPTDDLATDALATDESEADAASTWSGAQGAALPEERNRP